MTLPMKSERASAANNEAIFTGSVDELINLFPKYIVISKWLPLKKNFPEKRKNSNNEVEKTSKWCIANSEARIFIAQIWQLVFQK